MITNQDTAKKTKEDNVLSPRDLEPTQGAVNASSCSKDTSATPLKKCTNLSPKAVNKSALENEKKQNDEKSNAAFQSKAPRQESFSASKKENATISWMHIEWQFLQTNNDKTDGYLW